VSITVPDVRHGCSKEFEIERLYREAAFMLIGAKAATSRVSAFEEAFTLRGTDQQDLTRKDARRLSELI
jgi:hypothetical protein